MSKKILISSVVFLVLVILGGIVVYKKENPTIQNLGTKNEIILYYGDGCPHCLKVDEFIKDNKIEEKISFVRKEVFLDQNNSLDLAEKAKICGLDTKSVGVPFLWEQEATSTKCIIGDVDVINFFKTKTGIK
jgi:hypothetical protein